MPHFGVRRDTISCSAAISACGKAGRWPEALALFGRMPLGLAMAPPPFPPMGFAIIAPGVIA
eukprot:6981190-Prorocentrum_lima.AAC.1